MRIPDDDDDDDDDDYDDGDDRDDGDDGGGLYAAILQLCQARFLCK